MKLLMENWRNYLNDELLNEGPYDQGIFRAVFLAGGPGSGKSFVASRATGGHGWKVSNSDKAFEHLMREAGLSLDMLNLSPEEEEAKEKIRRRAKGISARQRQAWCDGRLGQVIDGTGDDYEKIATLRAQYEDMGYDTYMIFVNTSLETAKAWNIKRARSVPEDILVDSWKNVQSNMGAFQELFGKQNFAIVDNTPDSVLGTQGATPEDLEKIWKVINADFAMRPITNPIAREWLNNEIGTCPIKRPAPR
jgi:predicted kinase